MTTRTIDTTRKDWREHLDKIVRLGGSGAHIVYWHGPSDWNPSGKRKEVFDVMRGYYEAGKVHLFQSRVEDGYDYTMEVR